MTSNKRLHSIIWASMGAAFYELAFKVDDSLLPELKHHDSLKEYLDDGNNVAIMEAQYNGIKHFYKVENELTDPEKYDEYILDRDVNLQSAIRVDDNTARILPGLLPAGRYFIRKGTNKGETDGKSAIIDDMAHILTIDDDVEGDIEAKLTCFDVPTRDGLPLTMGELLIWLGYDELKNMGAAEDVLKDYEETGRGVELELLVEVTGDFLKEDKKEPKFLALFQPHSATAQHFFNPDFNNLADTNELVKSEPVKISNDKYKDVTANLTITYTDDLAPNLKFLNAYDARVVAGCISYKLQGFEDVTLGQFYTDVVNPGKKLQTSRERDELIISLRKARQTNYTADYLIHHVQDETRQDEPAEAYTAELEGIEEDVAEVEAEPVEEKITPQYWYIDGKKVPISFYDGTLAPNEVYAETAPNGKQIFHVRFLGDSLPAIWLESKALQHVLIDSQKTRKALNAQKTSYKTANKDKLDEFLLAHIDRLSNKKTSNASNTHLTYNTIIEYAGYKANTNSARQSARRRIDKRLDEYVKAKKLKGWKHYTADADKKSHKVTGVILTPSKTSRLKPSGKKS